MEHLSLHDPPPPGLARGPSSHVRQASQPGSAAPPPFPGPPPMAPQLPAQMFTTAAQLLDLTDRRPSLPAGNILLADRARSVLVGPEKLMVSLRDGRKFIGVLRSWDQYANLVLQDTVERIFVQRLYADIPRGIFIVRGENVVLLGEIDLDKDDYIPEPYREAPVELVKSLQRKEQGERARKDKSRHGKLQALGFEGDNAGEALL
ncbi:MAG: SM-like, degradation of cytoplasmic mRNAs and positively regulates transcription initiation [Lichina confinis]|nr:MAG: SM-like, degradation of cytoplasmic mRNAs and positively regulates transcription initiation [Lichina confinis]